MKAIIMAGGEGTRLAPITERMPKPLVPILGVPAIARIFRLLTRAGVTEAALTLKYRAQDLIDYCEGADTGGLRLTYFIEEEPLGTAGGIKAAERFTDSDFFVLSGDAVTDISLADAAAFHREKGAVATIVTHASADPTPFGGVVADGNGEVRGFREKPSWDRVLTSRVNTGIYVFSPRLFSRIPEGVFCDLAKDIFPSLVGHGLYAFHGKGYWCDIGDLDAYYACNFEAARGKIGGIPAANGHFLAEGADTERATLSGRCIIGRARLGKGAVLRDAILMDGVTVGAGARIDGAILCKNVIVGDAATVPWGCVIGEDTVIENGARIPRGARLGAGMIVRTEDMILEGKVFSGKSEDIFREFGLLIGERAKPALPFLLKCGAASVCALGRRVIFFDDGEASSEHIKSLLICGAMSAGGSATDGGEGFYSLASFSTVKSGADLGIFVKKTGEVHAVFFFDTAGAPVGLSAMRRVADALRREMETEFPTEKAGEDDYYGEYIHFLVDNAGPITEKLAVPEGAAGEAIYAAASLLGGFCEIGTGSMAAQGYIFVNAEKEGALEVSYRTADGSFAMIDRWHATAALLCEALKKGKKEVLLSASSPHALRDMVTGMGGTVRLYGSADTEALTREEALSALWQNDMLLLSLLFISSLGASREMPERASSFATAEKTLSVPDAAEVLSVLYDHGAGTEDGVLCLQFGSFLVRVTAKDSKTISLFAEAGTPHEAEDALRYAEKGILESVPSLQ